MQRRKKNRFSIQEVKDNKRLTQVKVLKVLHRFAKSWSIYVDL